MNEMNEISTLIEKKMVVECEVSNTPWRVFQLRMASFARALHGYDMISYNMRYSYRRVAKTNNIVKYK